MLKRYEICLKKDLERFNSFAPGVAFLPYERSGDSSGKCDHFVQEATGRDQGKRCLCHSTGNRTATNGARDED